MLLGYQRDMPLRKVETLWIINRGPQDLDRCQGHRLNLLLRLVLFTQVVLCWQKLYFMKAIAFGCLKISSVFAFIVVTY